MMINQVETWLRELEAKNQTDCERVQALDTVPEDETDFLTYTGLAVTIFSIVAVFLSVGSFALYRKLHSRTEHRNFTMLLAFSVGVVAYTFVVPFRDFYGQSEFPCDAYAALSFLATFLILIPQGCRLFCLYHRINFNDALIKSTFDQVISGEINALGSSQNLHVSARPANPMITTLKSKPKKLSEKAWDAQLICVGTVLDRIMILYWYPLRKMAPLLYCLSGWRHPEHVPETLQLEYFLGSASYTNLFCFVLFLLYLIIYVSFYAMQFAPFKGCTGCGVDGLYYVQLPVIGVFSMIYSISVSGLCKYPDALGIRRELLEIGIFYAFVYIFLVPLLNQLTDKPEERGTGNWSHLTTLAGVFVVIYCMPVQMLKARYTEANTGETLEQVLSNENGVRAFALHLSTELSLENFYFYQAVKAWKAGYKVNQKGKVQSDAVDLINLYVKTNSPLQINVSSSVRKYTEQQIFEANEILEGAFDRAQREIFHLMEADPFYRFKKSKYYKHYRNEIASTELFDL